MTSYIRFEKNTSASIIKRFQTAIKKPEVNLFRLSSNLEIPYIIIEVFDGESEKSISRKVKRAAVLLKNCGADRAVISDLYYKRYFESTGMEIFCDAGDYIKRFSSKVIAFAVSRHIIFDTDSICVISDRKGSNITFELLDTVSQSFREICVISENKEKASAVISDYFLDTGTPVLIGDGDSLKRCSVFISFDYLDDITVTQISRQALIIDLSGKDVPKAKFNRVVSGFLPYAGGEQGIAAPIDLMLLFASERIASFEIKSLIFS